MGRRMPGHAGPPRYGAYLLRCWEVRSDRPGQPNTWRFSLEQAGTGDKRRFCDLWALVAHLEQELQREDFEGGADVFMPAAHCRATSS